MVSNRWLLGLCVVVVFSLLLASVAQGFDWRMFFKPAALDWRNPYAHPGNYNPPWLYVLLHPLAKLDWPVGYIILTGCSLFCLLLYVESPLKLLAVVACAPTVCHLMEGQVDALVLSSLFLPTTLILAVAVMKPQGLGMAALRRASLLSIGFLVVVILLSLVVWGSSWVGNVRKPHGAQWLFWPGTIPLGVALTFVGWRKQSDAILCLATLCLVPYFSPSSITPFLAASLRETRGLIAPLFIVGLSWVWYSTFFQL